MYRCMIIVCFTPPGHATMEALTREDTTKPFRASTIHALRRLNIPALYNKPSQQKLDQHRLE